MYSVQVPPTQSNPYQEVDVMSGRSVALTCDVTGTPSPRIIWQLGTRVVANYPCKLILVVLFICIKNRSSCSLRLDSHEWIRYPRIESCHNIARSP